MSNFTQGTCPEGGEWYTCEVQTPTFFGCCTSNPCNGVGCPASDLRAAGIGNDTDGNLGINNGSCSSGGLWWTCSAQTPTFQGCCDSSPCNGTGTTCPSDQLHPAAFVSLPTTVSATGTPAATSQTQTPSSTQNVQSSSTSSSTSKSGTPVGTIVGGAVGGVVGGAILITILILAFLWFRHRQRQSSTLPTHEVPVGEQKSQSNQSTLLERGNHDSSTGNPVQGNHNFSSALSSQQASPLLPSYRSLSVGSPTPPDHHEIDSSTVHEVDSPRNTQKSMTFAAELPDTSKTSVTPGWSKN